MKHSIHKFKVRMGKDANDMLMRKLAYNFLAHGTMVTTEKKGKALSSYMARIVQKAKVKNEANKNYLLTHVSSKKVIANLFDQVGPVFKDVNGGYLTIKRLQQRYSDGAAMVKIAWSKPVIIEESKTTKKVKAPDEKTEANERVEAPSQAKNTKAVTAKKTTAVKKAK